jgi:hypothetical protein
VIDIHTVANSPSIQVQILAVEIAVLLRTTLQSLQDSVDSSILHSQLAAATKRANPTLRRRDGVTGDRYAFTGVALFLSTGAASVAAGPARGNVVLAALVGGFGLLLGAYWIQLVLRAADFPPVPNVTDPEVLSSFWRTQDFAKREINRNGDLCFTLSAAFSALLASTASLIPGA